MQRYFTSPWFWLMEGIGQALFRVWLDLVLPCSLVHICLTSLLTSLASACFVLWLVLLCVAPHLTRHDPEHPLLGMIILGNDPLLPESMEESPVSKHP